MLFAYSIYRAILISRIENAYHIPNVGRVSPLLGVTRRGNSVQLNVGLRYANPTLYDQIY